MLGSESYSDLNLTEPQIEFPGEETKIKYDVTSSDQQEGKKNLWTDQVLLYTDSLLFFLLTKFMIFTMLYENV